MNLLRLSLFFMTSLSLFAAAEERLYVGTYTQKGGSRGIYQLSLDLKTGALSQPTLAVETGSPSFLALHPTSPVLYAVDENGTDPAGKPTGLVSAFTVDRSTGGLALHNVQPIADRGPGACHVAVDPSGRVLVVANYGGGSVAAFPLLPNGQIGPRTSLKVQTGPLGPRVGRQQAPHAHCVVFAPDRSQVYAADLGLDRVYAYHVDLDHATLLPEKPAFISMPPGAGPRHVAFSQDGKCLYVANELDNTIALFERGAGKESFILRQTISTLPGDFHGESTVAELKFHPNGRFLFVSNRGHDSLAIYARELDHGTLALVEIVPCGGKAPRDFTLSSDGAWLVCAHQMSNSLAAFAVNAKTGKLTPAGPAVSVFSPVCLLFAPTNTPNDRPRL